MSNRKRFSPEDTKNIGLRIKSCRVLTGLTQEDFGHSSGIPVPSIKTWEFGMVIPRLVGLKKYCDILKNFGLSVTTDWILFGIGTGPTYFLEQQNNSIADSSSVLSDKIDNLKDIFECSCIKNKENPIIVEVSDNEMSPYYCLGDIIGGVLLDSNFNITCRKPFLVNLGNGLYAPRFLQIIDDEFFIYSLENLSIKKINRNNFAAIRWHYFI